MGFLTLIYNMVTPTETRLEKRKEVINKNVNFGKYLRTRRKY